MAKATRVHSTPRRTVSKIVEFPSIKRPLPADWPSAVAKVKKSGLRLIDDDTSTGKPATHEQCAAMEFKPWAGKSEGTEALTGENWMQHRVAVVFAHCCGLVWCNGSREMHTA